ncbi:MAG: radical SAM protein [Candidatus Aenigmatarchaeota archaeon]
MPGIMLISPPSYVGRRHSMPPMGLASIAGELRAVGHKDITIIDGYHLAERGFQYAFDKIDEMIKEKKPFITGITYCTETSEETATICCAALETGSHIVLGGHYATVQHEAIAKPLYEMAREINNSSRTAVARGEGEKTAKELFDALYEGKNLDGIKGVTFYDGKKVVANPDRALADINKLHPPAQDLLLPISEYGDIYHVEESRGCVYSCSFCSIHGMYPYARLKSPSRIREEAMRAKEIGAFGINLLGELALLDEKRALEIGDAMKELGMEWGIDAHPSLIRKRKNLIPILREKGLVYVETGVESAVQSSLDVFNKNTTVRKNGNAIKILKAAGIRPRLDFITFDPYISVDELEKNLDFIQNHITEFCNLSDYATYIAQSWVPTLGTPLLEKATADGLVKGRKLNPVYRDARVGETLKSYCYFLRNYEEKYNERRERIIGAIENDHAESEISDDRWPLIAALPLGVLYLARDCAKRGVDARSRIDSFTTQMFDAVDSGNSDFPFVKTYKKIVRKIDRRKRSKDKKLAIAPDQSSM